MSRFLVWLLLFVLASCSTHQNDHNSSQVRVKDTIESSIPESFDLQVKKYEDPKRQNWQDPKLVIEALGDLNNKVIADIGAGTGYFTFQLAVPAKKVIALDIEQRFLNYIEDRKTEMYDRNLAEKIETRITKPDSPSLEGAEVDIALMVNTIGFIENRKSYLQKLNSALTDLGVLVIVDYKQGAMPVGPSESSKVNFNSLSRELLEVGFSINRLDTVSLQYQYLIKVKKSS